MAEKTYLIINRRSGKAIRATGLDNGLVVEQAKITYADSELWTIKKTKTGSIITNKAAAKVLDVMQGGTENGTWVQTWENLSGESQLWDVRASSRGYKKITNIMADKVLDIKDLGDEDGTPAQIWENIGGENQEWKLEEFPKSETVEKVKKPVKKAVVKETPAKSVKATKTATKTAKKK